MFERFFKKKQLPTNESIYKLTDIPQNIWTIQQLKKQYEIAVIDDQKFEQAELLSNNDFKLKELGDISSIKSIQKFPIIICDIQGVGTKFDTSGHGGAFLISEIRKNYPDKYIIAYSTFSNDLVLQRHTKKADSFMPVPSSIEEWTQALETALKHVSNPLVRWKRFRQYLLDNDVELFEILKLEQNYIKYLINPNLGTENIDNTISQLTINPDLKDIIKQFTVSAMVEIGKILLTTGK